MAELDSEKKARRERDKLKQQTVRKLVKNMRDLENSLEDKDIATIHLKHGLFAIVDRDLFTTLDTKNWHVNIQPSTFMLALLLAKLFLVSKGLDLQSCSPSRLSTSGYR